MTFRTNFLLFALSKILRLAYCALIAVTLPLSLCLAFHAGTSYADIVNCDGQWTNKPCSKPIRDSIKEQPLDPRTQVADYAEKKEFLSNVSSYANQLLSLGVTFPVNAMTDFCLDTQHSVKDCQDNFEKQKTSFDQLAEQARKQASEDRETAKQRASEKVDQNKQSEGTQATNTVVVQQQIIERDKHRHDSNEHEIIRAPKEAAKHFSSSAASSAASSELPRRQLSTGIGQINQGK